MIDADLGIQGLVGALQLQSRAELLRSAGRIPINGEAIQGDGQLGGAITIQQVEAAAGRQEAFQAVARQGTPGMGTQDLSISSFSRMGA